MSNQVQNQPTAAYWLSMIGGILGLIGGLVLIAFGTFVGIFTFGIGFALAGGIGIWIVICSLIVMIAASKLKSNPFEHGKWGAIILVFSIIGGWSILDFIGGILAIVYKPIPVGATPYAQQQPYYGTPPQQTYQPPQQAHPCSQCGTMVQPGVRFCPNCGKQQY